MPAEPETAAALADRRRLAPVSLIALTATSIANVVLAVSRARSEVASPAVIVVPVTAIAPELRASRATSAARRFAAESLIAKIVSALAGVAASIVDACATVAAELATMALAVPLLAAPLRTTEAAAARLAAVSFSAKFAVEARAWILTACATVAAVFAVRDALVTVSFAPLVSAARSVAEPTTLAIVVVPVFAAASASAALAALRPAVPVTVMLVALARPAALNVVSAPLTLYDSLVVAAERVAACANVASVVAVAIPARLMTAAPPAARFAAVSARLYSVSAGRARNALTVAAWLTVIASVTSTAAAAATSALPEARLA